MVISTTFFSGATLDDTELGVVTLSASGGLNFVANMKNDSRRKATSHIAVMSMVVLLRGILALGILKNFNHLQLIGSLLSKTRFCRNSIDFLLKSAKI